MKREINTKFFTFDQNNSGGSFVRDSQRGICEYVIIEAINSDDANSRAENIGLYFNGCEDDRDCPCCGDRWYANSDKGEDVPSLYGKPIDEMEKSWYRNTVFVHYIDGTFKEVELKEKTEA